MGRKEQDVFHRFFSHVEKTQGCWNWLTALSPKGYGITWYKRKKLAAHRLAWIIFVGPIPEGMQVCHKCDNPKCVNPEHLFIGTNYDNVQDKVAKNRHKGWKYPEEKQPVAQRQRRKVRSAKKRNCT
jgi:hypothetical protein